MTQFTSFVAVEARIVNEGGQQRAVTVPVEMTDGVRRERVFGSGEVDTLAGEGSPSLSELSGELAAKRAAGNARLAMAPPSERLERRPAEAARGPEPEPAGLVDSADAAPFRPSPRAQTRLAPELLALIASPTASSSPARVVAGRVRVAVTLGAFGATERQALLAAGLAIEHVDDTTVVGWIEITKLAALAELDRVERIAPASGQGA
jgi:hypothetical protein